MTEAEALASINAVGTELVKKRGVEMDGFVMDDGWDSHERVYGFHDEFPDGFANVGRTARTYGAGIGVWMSPWGGYGGVKAARMKSGRAAGLETNSRGFSMSGKNYGAYFRNICFAMMKDYGVNYFKFDGMGGGNMIAGASAELADDVNAVLDLSLDIRRRRPDVWINATVGTWPSPFWTRYVDSIWRQGQDTSFAGVGNRRERWITYRDKFVHERIVQRGPLYPLNSLMYHGVVIGERHNPKHMPLDETSIRHEARSSFGCGTGLQELYLTPKLLTPRMRDDIAEAAKWSRARRNVLYDVHWVGGSPTKLQVYGWASWVIDKGTLTLRNPSDKTQSFTVVPKEVFELPEPVTGSLMLTSSFPDQPFKNRRVRAGGRAEVSLDPFEVLVLDVGR